MNTVYALRYVNRCQQFVPPNAIGNESRLSAKLDFHLKFPYLIFACIRRIDVSSNLVAENITKDGFFSERIDRRKKKCKIKFKSTLPVEKIAAKTACIICHSTNLPKNRCGNIRDKKRKRNQYEQNIKLKMFLLAKFAFFTCILWISIDIHSVVHLGKLASTQVVLFFSRTQDITKNLINRQFLTKKNRHSSRCNSIMIQTAYIYFHSFHWIIEYLWSFQAILI